jgi:hypothetical protein
MTTETPEKTKVLSNGAVYDMEKKRIVSGATLTSDTARDMVRAREAKRMRLYAEGAQLGVIDTALIEQYGPDAHLVERARTLQTIASTPDAGKAAVMADTALQRAQGYDVKQAEQAGPADAMGLAVTLLRELAAFASTVEISAVIASKPDAVDGEIVADDGGE